MSRKIPPAVSNPSRFVVRPPSRGWGSLLGAALLALSAGACTGGQPAQSPENPPPLEGDGPAADSGPVAAASSAKVQEGMDAIQAGDFAKAKEILTAAEADAPSDPQAAFYLGVALEGTGDTKGAAEKYEKALSLDAKLSEASVNLSAILLDGGDAKRALEVVKAALAHAPKHPSLLMNHALALEAAGDAAAALAAYGAAVKASPENLELRYAHAELLAGAGKKDEALAELRKVTTGAEPKLLAATANLFGKLQAFADCVSAIDKAVQKQPAADLYTRRGVCRHEMKDEAGAKADYEAAIKADPKFAPAHYYLGMHLKAAKKNKEAKASLQKAVDLAGDQGVGAAAKKALEGM